MKKKIFFTSEKICLLAFWNFQKSILLGDFTNDLTFDHFREIPPDQFWLQIVVPFSADILGPVKVLLSPVKSKKNAKNVKKRFGKKAKKNMAPRRLELLISQQQAHCLIHYSTSDR